MVSSGFHNTGLKGVILGFQLSFVGRFVVESYALVLFGLLVSLPRSGSSSAPPRCGPCENQKRR